MIAALALSLAGLGTLGAAGAVNATHQQPAPAVAISTAATAQRGCSSDCGLADEPTDSGLVACGWAVDDLPDAGWPQVGESTVSDALAKACDFRVTGERCEEDEICAVQQIRESRAFSG